MPDGTANYNPRDRDTLRGPNQAAKYNLRDRNTLRSPNQAKMHDGTGAEFMGEKRQPRNRRTTVAYFSSDDEF